MNFGIIVAGGKSKRMGTKADKAFVNLGTKPVITYSLKAFEECPDIDGIVLVVRKDRLEAAKGMVKMFGFAKVQDVVAGGNERQTSVANGLAVLGDEVKIVAVHDGARPCVKPELISDTIKSAKRYDSGVAAAKVTDTIKEIKRGHVVNRTVDRTTLWSVQTPQTFKKDLLLEGFAAVKKKNASVTDEASAVELLGKEVRIVPAAWSNVKITTPDDLQIAAALLHV